MDMPIDFFIEPCQTANIRAERFGICDPQDGGKAYVDFDHEEDWVAVVENRSGEPLNFTAIDNCIEILRPDGSMDNRCDAMLTGAGQIVFIELKIQKSDWIQHAVNDQLQTTIDHFRDNHSLDAYRKRSAYACNKSHPYFHHSNMELMNDFRRKNGVRLNIVNQIIIK